MRNRRVRIYHRTCQNKTDLDLIETQCKYFIKFNFILTINLIILKNRDIVLLLDTILSQFMPQNKQLLTIALIIIVTFSFDFVKPYLYQNLINLRNIAYFINFESKT